MLFNMTFYYLLTYCIFDCILRPQTKILYTEEKKYQTKRKKLMGF